MLVYLKGPGLELYLEDLKKKGVTIYNEAFGRSSLRKQKQEADIVRYTFSGFSGAPRKSHSSPELQLKAPNPHDERRPYLNSPGPSLAATDKGKQLDHKEGLLLEAKLQHCQCFPLPQFVEEGYHCRSNLIFIAVQASTLLFGAC